MLMFVTADLQCWWKHERPGGQPAVHHCLADGTTEVLAAAWATSHTLHHGSLHRLLAMAALLAAHRDRQAGGGTALLTGLNCKSELAKVVALQMRRADQLQARLALLQPDWFCCLVARHLLGATPTAPPSLFQLAGETGERAELARAAVAQYLAFCHAHSLLAANLFYSSQQKERERGKFDIFAGLEKVKPGSGKDPSQIRLAESHTGHYSVEDC